MPVRIAVDGMGGDDAPAVVVDGTVQAVRAAEGALHVLLFGPEARLRDELARHPEADALPIRVVEAPEIIEMGEAPAAAVKSKKRSSICLGLEAHKQGEADAFVSAGSTGAVMAGALFILGRLPGVARPSVIGFFPTVLGHCIVIDVGTNVDCKPEHLVQFAQMGSIYARSIFKHENPSIGLLNIGEEPGKGNDQVKATFELLRQTPGLHFRGNVEGRDVFHHAVDVVVCDGFVGNVILKLGESMATVLPHFVNQEFERQQLDAEEQQTVDRVVRGVRRHFDYEEYGGVPLLGVAGNVLIGHGGSTARAIERMIEAAAEVVEQNVAGAIAEALAG